MKPREENPEDYRDAGSLGETRFIRRSREGLRMINEKTSLSIKVILPLCGFLIAMTWRLGQVTSAMNSRLEVMWTISHQEEWARQARQANPNMTVPDARKIFDDVHDRKQLNKPINLVYESRQSHP